MQVTNTNFKEVLPAVQQALTDCQFYAFDLEMTGIHMRDGAPPYLDEMDDRYRQVGAVCEYNIMSRHSASPLSWDPFVSIPSGDSASFSWRSFFELRPFSCHGHVNYTWNTNDS